MKVDVISVQIVEIQNVVKMNREEMKNEFEAFGNKQFNILLSKGDDYANEDRLNNFKVAGACVGNSAAINCLNLIGTKVARLGVLLRSNKSPNNESIADSVLDLANYAFLLDCILVESTPKQLELFEHIEP